MPKRVTTVLELSFDSGSGIAFKFITRVCQSTLLVDSDNKDAYWQPFDLSDNIDPDFERRVVRKVRIARADGGTPDNYGGESR